MSAITWDDVVAVCGASMSAVDEDAQDLFLNFVNTALNVSLFGGEDAYKTRLARIYLAAHMGQMSMQGGTSVAGPVTSESVGGISRSYATIVSSASSGPLSGSSFADQYSALVATSLGRMPMVI